MGELIPCVQSVAGQNQRLSQHNHKNQIPWQLEHKSLDDKWKYLFENQLFTDVILIIGDVQDRLECHRLLLILHSPVFESMLSTRWSAICSQSPSSTASGRASSTHEELYLPDDDPSMLKLLLDVIYSTSSGPKSLSSASVNDTLSLLLLAKKYICPHVISSCISHLKTSASETNVVQIYQVALLVDEPELEAFTENYILTKACNLARIGEFCKFTKPELIAFVKRDDLNIDEVELFNAVYKWGEAHCEFDEDEAGSIEVKVRSSAISEVLQNILPLIRFPCMSLEDFSVQVVSKSILPLPETVQVYKYLSTPDPPGTDEASEQDPDKLQFSTQPRSRKIFTYIFKRLKGHGFDFGRKWQNLVLQVDQNIRLMSLGFFRSVKANVTLSIGVKIFNFEMDELHYEFEDAEVKCSLEEDVIHVKLPKPFEIKKNVDYTISYTVRGEETFYKSSEPVNVQLACCTDKKITFWIKEGKVDTDLDQIPEICFQLFG